MNYSSHELLISFKKAINQSLKIIGKEKIKDFWYSNNWTGFYRDLLLPTVAKELSSIAKQEFIYTRENKTCEWIQKEFLYIDCTFTLKAKNGYQVPIISIEYENKNDYGTVKEIIKLCSVKMPLKVLFLWENECFPQKEYKKIYGEDNEWIDVMEAFNEKYKAEDFIVIFVAELMNDDFKYHSFLLNKNGVFDDKDYDIITL